MNSHAEWGSLRESLTAIAKALEPLSEEMQARVLASASILVGVTDRVLDIVSGNADA